MDVNHATELATGFSVKILLEPTFQITLQTRKLHDRDTVVSFRKDLLETISRIRHTSGKVTEVLYNATVYRNEKGEVEGVFAAARDITERKQAEEALKERDALLRTMFEALPSPVDSRQRGRIIDGNQAGQQIWAGARYVGIDQFHEYKGWWLDTGRLIEPEDWACTCVRNGETSINEEIEIECFDGSHKIILNSAVPIRSERQEILGAFIVNEDITERKRIEETCSRLKKWKRWHPCRRSRS